MGFASDFLSRHSRLVEWRRRRGGGCPMKHEAPVSESLDRGEVLRIGVSVLITVGI